MPFSPGPAPVSGPPSVRQSRRGSTAQDADDWGMVDIVQGRQTPGGHHLSPVTESWHWVRAQIGTRPVHDLPRGDAGQSAGQVSGTLGKGAPYSIAGISRSPIYEGNFQYGPEVVKIARFFRAANTGWGGHSTIGRAAPGVLLPDSDNSIVIKKGLQRYPTRGPRSVSGAMNAKSRWDDTGRAPSIFVPTTPLK